MICVSLSEKTIQETINVLPALDFVELRLDLIADLSIEGFQKILDLDKRTIITFRPNGTEDHVRMDYFSRAIQSGATYIDIEYECRTGMVQQLADRVRKTGSQTRLILSYHNYELTPSVDILKDIIANGRRMGVELIKIATQVQDRKDNIRLLQLLETDENLVVIGMGEKGKLTRVSAPLLGSLFTFVSLESGKETAAGQLSQDQMSDLLRILK